MLSGAIRVLVAGDMAFIMANLAATAAIGPLRSHSGLVSGAVFLIAFPCGALAGTAAWTVAFLRFVTRSDLLAAAGVRGKSWLSAAVATVINWAYDLGRRFRT